MAGVFRPFLVLLVCFSLCAFGAEPEKPKRDLYSFSLKAFFGVTTCLAIISACAGPSIRYQRQCSVAEQMSQQDLSEWEGTKEEASFLAQNLIDRYGAARVLFAFRNRAECGDREFPPTTEYRQRLDAIVHAARNGLPPPEGVTFERVPRTRASGNGRTLWGIRATFLVRSRYDGIAAELLPIDWGDAGYKSVLIHGSTFKVHDMTYEEGHMGEPANIQRWMSRSDELPSAVRELVARAIQQEKPARAQRVEDLLPRDIRP